MKHLHLYGFPDIHTSRKKINFPFTRFIIIGFILSDVQFSIFGWNTLTFLYLSYCSGNSLGRWVSPGGDTFRNKHTTNVCSGNSPRPSEGYMGQTVTDNRLLLIRCQAFIQPSDDLLFIGSRGNMFQWKLKQNVKFRKGNNFKSTICWP